MFKKMSRFAALAVSACLLVACSTTPKETSTTQAEKDATTSTTSAATNAATTETGVDPALAASEDKVVLYSNAINDERESFLRDVAKEHGIDLVFVRISGNALANRLIAEKNAPIADVVFGMNQMVFRRLDNEVTGGMFEAFEPKWLKDVDAAYKQKDNKFFPINETRVFMVYMKDKMKDKPIVKDWLDAAEHAKGRYLVPANLRGATSNSILYTILSQFRDDSGNLGVSDAGWEAIEKYFANGTTVSEGQTPAGELLSGRVDYAFTWMSNVPVLEKQLGVEIGIVSPEYGVPQACEQVGLVHKDKIKPKAKEFVELLGSQEVMQAMAEKFGYTPVNKAAQASISERVRKVMDETHPQNLDYDYINEHLDDWVQEVELNYLKN